MILEGVLNLVLLYCSHHSCNGAEAENVVKSNIGLFVILLRMPHCVGCAEEIMYIILEWLAIVICVA